MLPDVVTIVNGFVTNYHGYLLKNFPSNQLTSITAQKTFLFQGFFCFQNTPEDTPICIYP